MHQFEKPSYVKGKLKALSVKYSELFEGTYVGKRIWKS